MPPLKRIRIVTTTLLVTGLAIGGLTAVPRAHAAVTRPSVDAGAVSVGQAAYAVPSGAIFVSPSGSDSGSGSVSSPVRTIARALAVVPNAGTIVLRAGSYGEYNIITKTVTIQNYPNEAVWLDGSTPVDGWVRDGSAWRRDGWSVRFDHSPTYTQGAPDSTNPYWQFVNPQTAPMAAHPDQVWIDGQQLKQVRSRSLVTTGSFYLDESTSKLYVGSDPANKQVRASNLKQAFSVRARDVTLRGIGIRRFAPSVFMLGTIVLEQPNARVENLVISENATTGISVLGSGAQIRKTTIERSGMLGIHARYADNLVIDRVLSQRNNSEGFNLAPVSGGGKIAQTRGLKVSASSFSNNYGHGFWTDMSVYNIAVGGTDFVGNSGDGLFLEISAKAIVGDSLFLNNKLDGLKVNNTSNVQIWNNTFIGNGRPLDLVQDNRRNTNRSDPAVDPRVAWPDPEMPWQLDSVTVSNNVVAQSTAVANCLLCVEDYSRKESAESMRVTANGNAYNRLSSSAPTWLAVWSAGAGNPRVFTNLAALTSATGQERRGREVTGSSQVSASGEIAPALLNATPQIALPLPSAVASAIGRTSGAVQLGAWTGGGTPSGPPPTPTPTPTPPPAPAGGASLAHDSFERNVSGGWGAADKGGPWSVPNGASNFTVGSGAGQLRLNPGDGFSAGLNNVSSSRTDLRFVMSIDSVPNATGHWIDAIARRVGDRGEYRAKIRIQSGKPVHVWLVRSNDGVVTGLGDTDVSGLTYNPGDPLRIRLQAVGTGTTQLRLRVWNARNAEPSAWSLTASDSTAVLQSAGTTGLYAYTGGSSTGGAVRMYFDEFSLMEGA